jgi:hypothetical protein
MQFETRSMEAVLADLIAKRQTLPPAHPDYVVLARMVRELRSEIRKKRPAIVAKATAYS